MKLYSRFFRFCLIIAGCCLLTLGCQYTFPEPVVDKTGSLNNADLSNTAFVGGTLFSGLQNGALTSELSVYSIPQIFLNHITNNADDDGMEFSPKVSSENGFNIFENQSLTSDIGQYKLVYPTPDTVDFARVTTNGSPFGYDNPNESISNYSFPKAQMLDFTETNRNENPFVSAFFNSTESIISKVSNQSPTFFVMNPGYEDILAYAINGAVGNRDQNNAQNHIYEDLISENLFETKLTQMVEELWATNPNAKGALMNIPNFLNFPYFIEVKFDITPFVNGSPLYAQMVQKANIYNNELSNYYQQNSHIPFDERRPPLDFAGDRIYNWGIIVTDEELGDVEDSFGNPLPKIRHALRGERIFYPVETKLNKSKGHFPENALSEKEYLKVSDLEFIENRINSFNEVINRVVAQSNGRLGLVDVNSYFDLLFEGLDLFLNVRADGVEIDGVLFYPGIEKLGIFSADGLNLNARGNALIVNQIIESLNAEFNGSISHVDVHQFPGTSILPSGN